MRAGASSEEKLRHYSRCAWVSSAACRMLRMCGGGHGSCMSAQANQCTCRVLDDCSTPAAAAVQHGLPRPPCCVCCVVQAPGVRGGGHLDLCHPSTRGHCQVREAVRLSLGGLRICTGVAFAVSRDSRLATVPPLSPITWPAQPSRLRRWAKATVDGFLFHVKAFGLFPSRSSQVWAAGSGVRVSRPVSGCKVWHQFVWPGSPALLTRQLDQRPRPSRSTAPPHRPPSPSQVSALPAEARSLLPPALQAQPQAYVRLGSTCPPAVEDACWRAFHAACEPLYRASRLGCILFQFHLSFQPSQANLEVCGCLGEGEGRAGAAPCMACAALPARASRPAGMFGGAQRAGKMTGWAGGMPHAQPCRAVCSTRGFTCNIYNKTPSLAPPVHPAVPAAARRPLPHGS